jgi:DNA repair protein RadC
MLPYENKLGIKAWAEADRPREKLLLQGRRQLTDAELMAIPGKLGEAEHQGTFEI